MFTVCTVQSLSFLIHALFWVILRLSLGTYFVYLKHSTIESKFIEKSKIALSFYANILFAFNVRSNTLIMRTLFIGYSLMVTVSLTISIITSHLVFTSSVNYLWHKEWSDLSTTMIVFTSLANFYVIACLIRILNRWSTAKNGFLSRYL